MAIHLRSGPGSTMRFLLDTTLGRLGRWLRTLGYDAEVYKGPIDRSFLNAAWKDQRIALTRKRAMAQRNFRGVMFVVEEDRVQGQLAFLIDKLGLTISENRLFTICLHCNLPLVPIPKETIRNVVPIYVYETQRAFMRCPQCGKIYWAGTHRDRALAFADIAIRKGPVHFLT